jgi:TolA-binding protein
VYERYPDSPDAVNALMTEGSIQIESGRYDEAQRLYQSVVDTHGDTEDQIVEASWQLARIAQAKSNWVDASLHYKLIYTRYPGTIQGLESPLRIASYYRERNEKEAAASAFNRAVEHYENLISSQVPEGVRVLAEEYVVRAFAEHGEWREAARRLLELPDRYPVYHRFRANYLKAASIHETELKEKKRAAEILQECMNRYPGTDLAAEAEAQYRRITDPK